MQIAIAGMKHVGATHVVFYFHGRDAKQDGRQMLARDRAVHAVVIRRNAPCSRERILAAGPEAQALRFVLRHGDGGRAGRLQHVRHARDFFLDFFRHAIGFA